MSKKQLSRQEEFEIMKLVMDKFLWVGVIIMVYGLYQIMSLADFWSGFGILLVGALIMLIFLGILLKEYKISK